MVFIKHINLYLICNISSIVSYSIYISYYEWSFQLLQSKTIFFHCFLIYEHSCCTTIQEYFNCHTFVYIYFFYFNVQLHISQYFECSPNVPLTVSLCYCAFWTLWLCIAISQFHHGFFFPVLHSRHKISLSLVLLLFLLLYLFSHIWHIVPLSFLLFLLLFLFSSMLPGRVYTIHFLLVFLGKTLVLGFCGFGPPFLHIDCHCLLHDPFSFEQEHVFWRYTPFIIVLLYLFPYRTCQPSFLATYTVFSSPLLFSIFEYFYLWCSIPQHLKHLTFFLSSSTSCHLIYSLPSPLLITLLVNTNLF